MATGILANPAPDQKNGRQHKNKKLGALSLLKQDVLFRDKWLLGRVVEVDLVIDKVVQVVKIKTNGEYLCAPLGM